MKQEKKLEKLIDEEKKIQEEINAIENEMLKEELHIKMTVWEWREICSFCKYYIFYRPSENTSEQKRENELIWKLIDIVG